MNSGLAKYDTTFGNDPFTSPSDLSWFEQPTSIAGIDGLVMTARERIDTISSVYTQSNVYAFTDRLNFYKIRVNDPGNGIANYDSPSIITTLNNGAASTLGLAYGPSFQFYGATEKIFLASDERITRLNLDGSGETTITAISSMVTKVPRPSVQFLGKTYFGNGNNLIEIDSTETITSYSKLSPGFPSNTYIRDLDLTPDGNYMQIIVSKNNSASLNQINDNASAIGSSEAYKFYWNGTDVGATASETYPGNSLTANAIFGQKNYMMGSDLNSSGLYDGSNKIWTLPAVNSPNYGATFSTGNLLGFVTTEHNSSVITTSSVVGLQASGFFYGQYDDEIPLGLFRMFRQGTVAPSTEVMHVPVCLPVSNLTYTNQSQGYANQIMGSGKIYFSASEIKIVGGSPDTDQKFYKFMTAPTGLGPAINGVYETQQETSLKLFRSIVSKKFKPTLIRFYLTPLVANNSFKIDIIGADGNPMVGGSQTFTVGIPPVAIGDDLVQYTPQTGPTFSMGIRITNLGTANWSGSKLEVEYEEFGI